jgi:cytochrome c-type biogenesis protein
MRQVRRFLRLAGALGVTAFALALVSLGGAGAGAAEPGPMAPEYTARVLGSEERASLSTLRGDVVLLNTWATWCEPCKEEMPAFEALYEEYRDRGLVVVAVSIDEGQSDGKVSRYVESLGVTFPIWRDPANRFAKDFRVLGVPETLLIDRDGRIRHHWRGQVHPDEPADRSRILNALGLEKSQGETAATATVASAGLLVAFGAGLVSVLSPCVLPLIPSYASVIAGVGARRSRRTANVPAEEVVPALTGLGGDNRPRPAEGGGTTRRAALWAGFSFVAGFSTVFMALGVLVNRAGAALSDNRVWLSRLGGVVLVVLGLHLLGIVRLRAADREIRFLDPSGRAGHAGVFFIGVAFAAGWSPCIGPVLAGILTMAASGGSTLQAVLLLGAYCTGLAIPFLVAAFALDRFLVWSGRLRRSWLPVAERVSGAIVIGLGLLLMTGVFTRLSSWMAT